MMDNHSVTIGENIKVLLETLPEGVALIAISKTFDAESVRRAYQAGQRDFGENKVQELLKKSEMLSDLNDIRWHFVGHLQSNKVKHLLKVPNLHMVHSIDRLKVAQRLAQRLEQESRELKVLIQVNTSNEASKYGCTPEEALELARCVQVFSSLQLNGLMTIGKLGGSDDEVRHCFSKLKLLAGQMQQALACSKSNWHLSMGMTTDYRAAVSEGSTMVRIGQAVFGTRSTPDSYYWPE